MDYRPGLPPTHHQHQVHHQQEEISGEMPGHVKRGGTGEPDPDPTEYLFITYEEKQKVDDKAMSYFDFDYCILYCIVSGPCEAVRPKEELLVPIEGGRIC